MNKKITVLAGDGIGPEVTKQALKALESIGKRFEHQFEITHHLMGAVAIDKTGDPLPEETLEACLKSDAVLLGAIGHPRFDHDPSAKVRPEQGLLRLRKSLGLYANIRPVTTYPSLYRLSPLKPAALEGVDLIMFRELTGGLYFGEKSLDPETGTARDVCTYTRQEVERITVLAFRAAQQRRNKLTLVDKANVLETSRLWRKVVQEMAADYPDVQVDYLFVDNAAMQLILNPAQFDVILTENLFGDILSDEAAVLGGSIGLLPSASIGQENALFEPIHGSWPQAAGKDIANPFGAILSVAMLLDHFGGVKEAQIIRDAIAWALQHGFVTKDIDPVNYYATSVIGDLVSDYIEDRIPGAVSKAHLEISKSTII